VKLDTREVRESARFKEEAGALLAHQPEGALEGSSSLLPFAHKRMPDTNPCPRQIDTERVTNGLGDLERSPGVR
jgi:hypothetical protein